MVEFLYVVSLLGWQVTVFIDDFRSLAFLVLD